MAVRKNTKPGSFSVSVDNTAVERSEGHHFRPSDYASRDRKRAPVAPFTC